MTAAVHIANQVAIVAFPLMLIVAGATDVTRRRIPNLLCISLALIFFPLALAAAMPLWLIGLHVTTGIILLMVGYGLFAFGWVGGGDAKLLAAAGLWIGFPSVLPFLLLAALAGGVLAAAIGLWFMVSMEASVRSDALGNALSPLAPDVPYGFALAAGAILTIPFTWMAAASVQT